jgi:alpha-tubulin suppressor-like RCC1 family protein
VAVGYNTDGQCNVSSWTGIVQVAVGYDHTVGLKTDGTVVAVGKNSSGQCTVGGWDLSPGIHIFGHIDRNYYEYDGYQVSNTVSPNKLV